MKEKISENKKLIIIGVLVLLLVGISAFFLLKEDKTEEVDRYANMTDEEIIAEGFDNIEKLNSFQVNAESNRESNDITYAPNFSYESTVLNDLENMIIHAKFDEVLNGEESFREYYHKVEGDTYMLFNYYEGEWFYEDREFTGTFYTIDFFRDIIDKHEYTSTREDGKLIVNIEYDYEDLKDEPNAEYFDKEMKGTYEFVFEDGYLIEFSSTLEDSKTKETNNATYNNFNKKMNIVIPDDVLELKE